MHCAILSDTPSGFSPDFAASCEEIQVNVFLADLLQTIEAADVAATPWRGPLPHPRVGRVLHARVLEKTAS